MKAILAILAFCLTSAGFGNESIHFSEIGPNDEIEVLYRSVGCFHFITYKFIFTQGGKVRVWERDPELQKQAPEWGWGLENQMRFIGGKNLTDTELSTLSRLTDNLRNSTGGSCTTTSTLDIRYRREGFTIGFEKVEDANCEEMGFQTNFWTIAYTLKDKTEENK